ncbi:MAG: sulfatase-like hydrolase/transferase [Anaerolineae bacterium]|jgi:arylsulfatase A-like enzyme|nr:sulfatase-like hydrolase/transferase [Anaerolineae bacterium]
MTKPNLVIFNPDQWRADVMGHFGNPAAKTPAMDALVESEAVSFRRAFCQNTVCTPSRCSFMTGLYPHVHGHRTMFHMLHEERGQRHLFAVLKEQGYYLWWGGKNDLFPGQEGWGRYVDEHFTPTAADFQRWGSQPAEGNHAGDLRWRGAPDEDNYYSFYKGRLEKGDQELYLDSDWQNVLGAIDFIRSYDGTQPFVVYLPLSFPHPPYCAEEPYYSSIDRDAIPDPFPAPPDWEGKPSLLQGIAERQHLQGWTEERWRELRATYYAMCARVDHQAGLVLNALREAGLYDDTAFFLFSDHGDFTGDYGLVEKTQNTFEDCLSNVPLIIKPPQSVAVQPGIRETALVELVDFSATVYDLLGIDPGYDHFGRSLLPVLAGAETHRDAVFCEGGRRKGETQAMELESTSMLNPDGLYYPRVGLQAVDDRPYHSKAAMCRTNDFKYTLRLYEQDELYDLCKDPGETTNVINDPVYAAVARQLKDRLLLWYMETCDVVPRDTDLRGFTGK